MDYEHDLGIDTSQKTLHAPLTTRGAHNCAYSLVRLLNSKLL
jgi:hypothetical protein